MEGNKISPIKLMALAMVVLALAACTAFPTVRPRISSTQTPPAWTLVEAPGWGARYPGFSLHLPPGWELYELQGIDSYVGEVVGDGVRFTFDYGMYSWTLKQREDMAHLHTVTYETIGGVEAKLIVPTGDSGGYTGVYFAKLDSASLNLVGKDLTPAQQQVALSIFRSIRSLGQ